MKRFHCSRCESAVYPDLAQCPACQAPLGFVPEQVRMCASVADASPPQFHCQGQAYRACANMLEHGVCNWLVPDADPAPLCRACRVTVMIPDLSVPGHREHWAKLESAKRRLLVGLLGSGLLGVDDLDGAPGHLRFQFLADGAPGSPATHATGHQDGLITINLAEADDAERERRRVALREPYRTLLGHFRHEVGHYYWDRLIRDTPELPRFRARFGDERADYTEALHRHYTHGAPAHWSGQHVSAYASMHPWEDWAETFAHYLHMSDALETAEEGGLWLRPRRRNAPAFAPRARPSGSLRADFLRRVERWRALSYVLNELHRGLAGHDAYPFELGPHVVEKLAYVHRVVERFRHAASHIPAQVPNLRQD